MDGYKLKQPIVHDALSCCHFEGKIRPKKMHVLDQVIVLLIKAPDIKDPDIWTAGIAPPLPTPPAKKKTRDKKKNSIRASNMWAE